MVRQPPRPLLQSSRDRPLRPRAPGGFSLKLLREPQRKGDFTPGVPSSGYYNDLRIEIARYATPAAGVERFDHIVRDRLTTNPVAIVQLGLGAWQRLDESPGWLEVVDRVTGWIERESNADGVIVYHSPMAHTYTLPAPWASAMAQGEAASLLVRASDALARPELLETARLLIRPLLDERSSLVAVTPEGPVLQEYPTNPPAHVLNGWIWALWGLYDVAVAADDDVARSAFADGVAALAERLHLYATFWGWSRYDLYPHPLVHAASPFYHALHVEQLLAMNELAPDPRFAHWAEVWGRARRNPVSVAAGAAFKAAFRVVKPRRP